jgi:hypothetical protein
LCSVVSNGVCHDLIGPRMAPKETYRELANNITNYHVAGEYGRLLCSMYVCMTRSYPAHGLHIDVREQSIENARPDRSHIAVY